MHATADQAWPYSSYFKGDALTFLQQASTNSLLEGGAPFRPPGVALILWMVWDKTVEGFAWIRYFWILLGALPAPLLYLLCRAPLGERVARIAGGLLAIASGPMLISASLCSEAPYLLVAVLSVGWLARLSGSAHWLQFLGFGALQGIGCLLRVEHALFLPFALVWTSRRQAPDAAAAVGWARCAATALAFGLVLLPWHLHIWGAVDKLNNDEQQGISYTLDWSEDAKLKLQSLPSLAHSGTVRMLEDTVQARGRRRVDARDFAILEEAYDYVPQRLTSYPFLSLYGPLNFFLANHPDCGGGFSRRPLFAPPPLRGGPEQYPPGLAQSLPVQLSLSYPPHLKVVNHGYALGVASIFASPGRWCGIVTEKLARFWAGAATGLGGYALPIGMSGVRHRVDVVTAQGWWARSWRLLVLALCALGAATGWRRPSVQPWLLWIAIRVLLVILFFGYARQGILIAPSVAILIALALDRFWCRAVAGLCVAVVCTIPALEVYRCLSHPAIIQDGVELQGIDPSATQHQDRRIEFR